MSFKGFLLSGKDVFWVTPSLTIIHVPSDSYHLEKLPVIFRRGTNDEDEVIRNALRVGWLKIRWYPGKGWIGETMNEELAKKQLAALMAAENLEDDNEVFIYVLDRAGKNNVKRLELGKIRDLKNLTEARVPFVKYDQIDDNTKRVAIDHLESLGFAYKFDADRLAILRRVLEWDRINLARQIKSLQIRQRTGMSWLTYYVFDRMALLEYCKFLNISPTHVEFYHLDQYDYPALLDEYMLKEAATQVITLFPELFVGKLTGINHVDRCYIDYRDFTFDVHQVLAAIIPSATVSKVGGVYHCQGLEEIMKFAATLLYKKYKVRWYHPTHILQRLK